MEEGNIKPDIEFPPLTNAEFKELQRLSRMYRREAERCRSAKAHLAGSVMLGAWVETVLLIYSDKCRDEIGAAGLVPKIGTKGKALLKWTLAELLRNAQVLDWLPSGRETDGSLTLRNAKVGDYAEIIRTIRNLLHPGRYVSDHRQKRVNRSDLEFAFTTCENIRKSLVKWSLERRKKLIATKKRSNG